GETYDLSGLSRSFDSLNDILSHLERSILAEAYRRHHSSYQVAKHLGISQSTAMRKAYKYGIREKGLS
ncbi:MAG: TyrR/PhhR family helix-turn-helix DNA-binding protein, partial [Planifilum fimeticola]